MTDPNLPRTEDPAPLPPDPPEEGECCESECGEACVWTAYYEARADWERAMAAWRARQG